MDFGRNLTFHMLISDFWKVYVFDSMSLFLSQFIKITPFVFANFSEFMLWNTCALCLINMSQM